jgi:hypothetical protein
MNSQVRAVSAATGLLAMTIVLAACGGQSTPRAPEAGAVAPVVPATPTTTPSTSTAVSEQAAALPADAPCKLVSRAELGRLAQAGGVTSIEVNRQEPESPFAISGTLGCVNQLTLVYKEGAVTGRIPAIIRVELYTRDAQRKYEDRRTYLEGVQELNGVGDRAFWSDADRSVFILQGDLMARAAISWPGHFEDHTRAVADALAPVLARNLP